MSRISASTIEQIKRDILRDLYSSTQKRFDLQAIELAKASRACWLLPYQPILDKLPKSLITVNTRYTVKVNYPWDRVPTEKDISTDHVPKYTDGPEYSDINYINSRWSFTSPTPIINPITIGNYGHVEPEEQQIHKDVQKEAGELCDQQIKLIREYINMQNYLEETTKKNNTHKQLEAIWHSSLHKYLPAKVVKSKTTKKEQEHIKAPDFLEERLTTNLLEDY